MTDKTPAEIEDTKCSGCDNAGTEERHSCPYKCEVDNICSDDFCNCCEVCTQNCRDII